ncbi:hypothetical protein ACFPYJ_16345 [Paenibacillus solisilvae]|uniref:Uncharacterized protein n=1 Tax=Paenibacillus solisilvae TaxID=2486751 RepID=A0ABW0W1S5_9BACL
MNPARLAKIERSLLICAFTLCSLFVVLLIALKWPSYWVYIASEQTPMTWLQSVIWFGCVLFALLSFTLLYIQEGLRRHALTWLMLAGAFLFLMMDERFAFHERVRDHYLKPAGIKILPWMEAGDFILLMYAVVALAFVIPIYRVYRVRRTALIWLGIAAILFATAVGMDTLDVSKMSKATERFEQSMEEIIELLAVLSLFSSVWLMIGFYLSAFRGSAAAAVSEEQSGEG